MDEGTGERDALALTSGDRGAAVVQLRVVAHRHSGDVVMNAGDLGRLDYRFER